MAQVDAQLHDVDPYSGFEPVPPGEYAVRVVDSKVSTSKTGNAMAEFELEIEGPGHLGSKLWERFVLNNDIARKRLKGFLVALGHANPSYLRDTEEIHGLRCLARVGIEHDETGKFDDKNKVKGFKPLAGGAPAPAQGADAPPRQRPWPGPGMTPGAAAPASSTSTPPTSTPPTAPPPWQRPAD